MATLLAEPRLASTQLVRRPEHEPSSRQTTNASQLEHQHGALESDHAETSSHVRQPLVESGLNTSSKNPTASPKQEPSAPQPSNANRVGTQNGALVKAITPTNATNDQRHITCNPVPSQKGRYQRNLRLPSSAIDSTDQCEPARHGAVKQEVSEISRATGRYQDVKPDTDDAIHSPATTTSPFVPIERLPTTASVPPNAQIPYQDATTLSSKKKIIPFDEKYTRSLGHKTYMDQRDVDDEVLLGRWNNSVEPQLAPAVNLIVKKFSTGDRISALAEFKMVGKRHNDELDAESTIVITCPTTTCRKKLKEHFEKVRPYYLETFIVPIKFKVAPAEPKKPWKIGIPHWTTLSDGNPSTVIGQGLGDLKRLSIEDHYKMSSPCGLKLKLEMNDGAVEHYATLGGVIAIGDTLYGMTTAHTFLADLQVQTPSSLLTHSDDSDESSDITTSDIGSESSIEKESTQPSFTKTLHFDSLYSSLALRSFMLWSFQGQFLGMNHSVASTSSMSDWVVFEVGHTLVLPNLHGTRDLLSVTPESQLITGDVWVLCGVDGDYKGLLTSSNASVHTQNGAMSVREVLLDSPLPLGSSGAWVIRDERICGYVVASTWGGLSCFMVPMERAFREIELVSGKKVNLKPTLKDSKAVGFASTLERPIMEDRMKVQSPGPLVTSDQHPAEKLKGRTSDLPSVEVQDPIEFTENDILHEIPKDEKTKAKAKPADTVDSDTTYVFPGSPRIVEKKAATVDDDYKKLSERAMRMSSAFGDSADDMLQIASKTRTYRKMDYLGIFAIDREKIAFPKLAFASTAQYLFTLQLVLAEIGRCLRTNDHNRSPPPHILRPLERGLDLFISILDTLREFTRLHMGKKTIEKMWKIVFVRSNYKEIHTHVKDGAGIANNLLVAISE